jgi:formylglycine-generating enzyme required for sulfatase activity
MTTAFTANCTVEKVLTAAIFPLVTLLPAVDYDLLLVSKRSAANGTCGSYSPMLSFFYSPFLHFRVRARIPPKNQLRKLTLVSYLVPQSYICMPKLLFTLLLLTGTLIAQPIETITLPGTDVSFNLAQLPGGTFAMGEKGKAVTLSPFSIGTHEITFDAYRLYARRDNDNATATMPSFDVDAVTRPTPPYLDYTYGMGTRGGFPQVNLTQQGALGFCKWLYQKTGRFYRLPTEAEWEYACLASKESPASEDIEDYAWLFGNGEEVFHKTGLKKPNAWGLYDMLGNVSEWTLDHYAPDYFDQIGDAPTDPWIEPTRKHSRTVRGGSFDTDTADVGCRVREKSQAKWQARDPQIPRSKWWNVDSPFLGFRIVSPKKQPTKAQITEFFNKAIVH